MESYSSLVTSSVAPCQQAVEGKLVMLIVGYGCSSNASDVLVVGVGGGAGVGGRAGGGGGGVKMIHIRLWSPPEWLPVNKDRTIV